MNTYETTKNEPRKIKKKFPERKYNSSQKLCKSHAGWLPNLKIYGLVKISTETPSNKRGFFKAYYDMLSPYDSFSGSLV